MKMKIGNVEYEPSKLNYAVAYEDKNQTNIYYVLTNTEKKVDVQSVKDMDLAKEMFDNACGTTHSTEDAKIITLKQGMLLVNFKNINGLSFQKIANISKLGSKYQSQIKFKDSTVLPVALYEDDVKKLETMFEEEEFDMGF